MSENKSERIASAINLLALKEIETLKKAFADNEGFLVSIRALLLGFPVKKSEADVIESVFKDKDVREAFRNKLYLKLSPTTPIGQGGDYWYGTDTEIVGKDPETIGQIINSKHRVLEMLEQAMALLENPFSKENKISLDFKSTKEDPFQIEFLARNKYINTVQTALSIVKVVSGMKSETPEQTKKRLLDENQKNSNK